MPDDLRHLIDALDDVAHEPGVSKPDPILVVDHVKRQFGGLTAVDVCNTWRSSAAPSRP